jgi:signal transduction histidine kinase
MADYERGIDLARRHGHALDEALGHELAARFYGDLGQPRLSADQTTRAARAFLAWGSPWKAARLCPSLPELAPPRAAPAVLTSQTLSSSGGPAELGGALDLATVTKASHAMAEEIVLDALLEKLVRMLIENAGAERGALLLADEGALVIEAVCEAGGPAIALHEPLGDDCARLSAAIVGYVARTRESVVLADAAADGVFARDPYVAARRPRSVLSAPLVHRGRLTAVVYMENNLVAGAFAAERLTLLRLLSSQAALSIHNARLYARLEEHGHELERTVDERTRELRAKNDELARTLDRLRAAQRHLVSQEKLASLGALTAGIAHELKNPLNFVNNFAQLTADLTLELVEAARAPGGGGGRADVQETAELVRGNVLKISEHGARATRIIDGMLQHAGGGASRREATRLNGLVGARVGLARHAARSRYPGLDPSVIEEYDPAIDVAEIAAPDIARVLLSVLDNAFYAVDRAQASRGPGYAPEIGVRTRDGGDAVVVSIRDNGTGIAPADLGRVFEPFFTTKPAGLGTGLGLSVSHDIVKGHGGEIRVASVAGEHTEITITLPKRAP